MEPKPEDQKASSSKDDGMHFEAKPQDQAGADHLCDSAPDKEKCEEFVSRLDEASGNIDPKQ